MISKNRITSIYTFYLFIYTCHDFTFYPDLNLTGITMVPNICSPFSVIQKYLYYKDQLSVAKDSKQELEIKEPGHFVWYVNMVHIRLNFSLDSNSLKNAIQYPLLSVILK